MNGELQPEQIERDMLVTVVRCLDTDRSFQGRAFTVREVALPFVAAFDECWGTGVAIDTRRFVLMQVTPEYLAAMKEKAPR